MGGRIATFELLLAERVDISFVLPDHALYSLRTCQGGS